MDIGVSSNVCGWIIDQVWMSRSPVTCSSQMHLEQCFTIHLIIWIILSSLILCHEWKPMLEPSWAPTEASTTCRSNAGPRLLSWPFLKTTYTVYVPLPLLWCRMPKWSLSSAPQATQFHYRPNKLHLAKQQARSQGLKGCCILYITSKRGWMPVFTSQSRELSTQMHFVSEFARFSTCLLCDG